MTPAVGGLYLDTHSVVVALVGMVAVCLVALWVTRRRADALISLESPAPSPHVCRQGDTEP